MLIKYGNDVSNKIIDVIIPEEVDETTEGKEIEETEEAEELLEQEVEAEPKDSN